MVFSSTGSIATYINTKYILPAGVSGTMDSTVSLQRIKVQNYTGVNIPSDNIQEAYQDIITDFSAAEALDDSFAWMATVTISGGTINAGTANKRKLGDMDVSSDATALNFLSSLSKDTPTKLRESARASMEDLGRETFYYKANG
jgi:hypothetical protein